MTTHSLQAGVRSKAIALNTHESFIFPASLSSPEPDWSRERLGWFERGSGKRLLRTIRKYQAWHHCWGPIGALVSRWYVAKHCFWSIVSGADIPINTGIGGGLMLPHPNGVVVHDQASIGSNCLICQQVTIGVRRQNDVPIIGDGVCIGAGAKILGSVHIGNYAKVGASAVVLKNVPAYATAVGIPARIITRKQEA
jgi:serine O-acetyltransferase